MQTISLFGTLLVVATLGATSVHADKQAKMNKRLATCEKKSKVVHKKIANLKSDIGDALESAFGCNAGKYAASDDVACQVWTNPTADDCADGSIWTTGSATEDSTCVPCAAGHFSASDNAACQVWTNPTADDCADGSIWTTGSATEDSTCVPCAAGHFSWGDNVACQVWTNPTADDCANGSIWTTGSTSEDSTCVPCAAGHFSASDNAACKVWTYAAADDCANGSIWTTGSTTEDSTCVPCAAGHFSASDNAACAPHTSCGEQADGSTRLTGASSTAAGSCEVCDGKTLLNPLTVITSLAESDAANCVPAPLVFQAADVSTSSFYQGYTAKWSVDGKVKGGTIDGKFVGISEDDWMEYGGQAPNSWRAGMQIQPNKQQFTMSNPGGGTDGEWWSVKVSDTMAPITLASVTITQVPYIERPGTLGGYFDAAWDLGFPTRPVGVTHPSLGQHEIWISEEPGGHGSPGNVGYSGAAHPKGQATKCGGETAPNGKEDYEHTTSVSCGTVQGKYVTIWLPPCCHKDFYGGSYETFGTRKNKPDISCVKDGLARNISESSYGCRAQAGLKQATGTRTILFDEVVVRATVGEP